MNTIKVIINADDFGCDSSINAAILEAFHLGYITSTTIMANMDGFEEAVKLASQNNLIDRVGIHLNITEGIPVSEKIKYCITFCDSSGYFRHNRDASLSIFKELSSAEQEALETEIKAQINKCRDYGLILSHADSHHHKHTEWNINQSIMKVLREEGIHKIRISRNMGAAENANFLETKFKKYYKGLFNNHLKRCKFTTASYFGSFEDLKVTNFRKTNKDFTLELMCHPQFQGSVLVDEGTSLADKYRDLKAFLLNNDCKFISYMEETG